MEPVATFSGIASGIDFRAMVDQIIAAESQPIRQLEIQISSAETRSTAWESFRKLITSLESSAEAIADPSKFRTFLSSVSELSSSSGMSVAVDASSDATPGTYSVKVLQLATNEKVGSNVFASKTAALGYSGEFLVNGRAMSIAATDTLVDVRDTINQANTGTNPSGVSATIVSSSAGTFHLVLTSDASGAEGIDLADGSSSTLRSLGFLGSTTSVNNPTSDGAKSRGLTSATATVASLLGLTSPPSGTVKLGTVPLSDFDVVINLNTDSLNDIAEAINVAASAAGKAVTATVVQETDASGNTVMRLDISGTTAFSDTNGVLETLGVLKADRAVVAQEIQSGTAFTEPGPGLAATGATLLTNLWSGGASRGVVANDTLTLSGTRADGTTFTKTLTVGAGIDTLGDLLTSLNSASDAFGVGSSTATATLVDGQIVITDDSGGDSQLALSIVANNENGGTLDFGDFAIVDSGRARELTAGVDARVQIDGDLVTRSSNSITDAVTGLTLNLLRTATDAATVTVGRDVGAMTSSVEAFMDAFNGILEFVSSQFSGAGAEEGTANAPLSGDSVLRQMRNDLREAMAMQISAAVGGDFRRLADIGIEVTRDGVYELDKTTLQTALETDPQAVERLLGLYGAGSVSSLSYLGASDSSKTGTYSVEITQVASKATVTGSSFAGTYVDDATADTLTVQDLDTSSDYAISLSNGMTMSQIVTALNSEFATAKKHEVQAANTMYSDAGGTPATDATTLDSLFETGPTTFDVTNGDTFTISGTRADGTTFLDSFAVTDISTQTLGDLRAAVEKAVGTDEVVTFQNGNLNVTAQETGRSLLTLSVTSDNAGAKPNPIDFGTISASTQGRGTAGITASDSGGQLKLDHGDYGSVAGFQVSYTAGGTDGSASLGVTAASYAGNDVLGTIGGLAATGVGQLLIGDADTAVDGLLLRYDEASTGTIGDLIFSRGIASALEVAAAALLTTGAGTITGIVEEISPLVHRLKQRIDAIEGRLERRRESLIKKFVALEQALALAQAQGQWMIAQLQSLSASRI